MMTVTHGMSKTRLYRIWRNMLFRCGSPKCSEWKNYGERGIFVCKSWQESFENFYHDMGDPEAGQSIDRIDNTKGYSKENCRWASLLEQANNKRNNKIVEHNGVSMSVSSWSRKSGVGKDTITYRLEQGWSSEDAIFKPVVRAKSGLKSVYFRPATRIWTVKAVRNGENVVVGLYDNLFEAACSRLGNEFKEKVPHSAKGGA